MSAVAFSIIETLHLFGLIFLFGCVFVLNLRLLGGVMDKQPAAKVARDLAPYAGVSVAVMIGSGMLLFTSAAAKYYANTPFRIKMVLLVMAGMCQLIACKRMVAGDARQLKAWPNKILGVACLLLWIGVAVAGRAIAFF